MDIAYDLDRLRLNDLNFKKSSEEIRSLKREALTYDDILLVPQYSDIKSRKEIDISSSLDSNIKLKIPIISSPMDTVTETEMAIAMDTVGGLGIVHRYNSIEEQVAMIAVQNGGYKAAAIGVSYDFKARADALVRAGIDVLCLDVAHGHHILMERALKSLKDSYGKDVHLMAGNVATLEGFNDLADWGADSVRCGIGGGSICSTRIQTGHGVPGLETIFQCAQSDRDAKIIADGGIKNSGDIVKALALGADFVMLGSLLAGTTETPGEILTYTGGNKYKAYRGMASKKAQEIWRGRAGTPEGVETVVPYRGSVKNVINDLCGGLRSGLSYSGAKTIKQFRTKVKTIRQTVAGQHESVTHILAR